MDVELFWDKNKKCAMSYAHFPQQQNYAKTNKTILNEI